MTRTKKMTLGILTLWAAAYAFCALAFDLSFAEDAPGAPLKGVTPETVLIALSAANALVIFAIYTAITFASPRIPAMSKVAWPFAMLFFYPFVILVFWYQHVLHAEPPKDPPPQ